MINKIIFFLFPIGFLYGAFPSWFLTTNKGKYLLSKWSKKIIKRDKVCIRCGSKIKLHAHHIYPKSKFPRKAFWIGNGVTLCKGCHQVDKDSYHQMHGYKGNKRMFLKWLRVTKR